MSQSGSQNLVFTTTTNLLRIIRAIHTVSDEVSYHSKVEKSSKENKVILIEFIIHILSLYGLSLLILETVASPMYQPSVVTRPQIFVEVRLDV